MASKLVSQTKIKSSGDVFHDLLRHQPHQISDISSHVQSCDLHDGEWGTEGSIISWNYVHDGKDMFAKEIVEVIDEEKKSITFKVIEGNVLEIYKNFKVTCHVDTEGEDHLVTWTFEYEKMHEDVEDPHTLMDVLVGITKDIESHHLDPKTDN
ncbi:MLP-like protein 34-like [Heracleum sosnowskyi]|uniref:MLP-like protein 34-like n=1 Tax=Heracleum sosnowskyi TaxID=360622 RepID=A0AAD8MPG1_9APIA|nr:MLP-like protein 34-like [Heracleum sosnowskyi]